VNYKVKGEWKEKAEGEEESSVPLTIAVLKEGCLLNDQTIKREKQVKESGNLEVSGG